jgi:hypothetical protein
VPPASPSVTSTSFDPHALRSLGVSTVPLRPSFRRVIRESLYKHGNENPVIMAGQSKEALIPPWGLAVAGATGAVIANAIVYPLDM